uniref:GDP-L-fucose synthase n=1 Tax=Kwoniella dejecticola CBS 10117 TaxID=1296121 RepID=A0A1A6AFC4_9TREE|nr:uncharacterized protein I303_00545 [Kwoniella dejecticola CBS 10117]OBR88728.1 hypothetical protein I303_00545 [Kwoniella dejecticola CBS 10117]
MSSIGQLPPTPTSASDRNVILVTGGSGLVGSALKYVIEHEPLGSPYGKRQDEEWIFLSSNECDLRDIAQTRQAFEKYRPRKVIHLAARVGGLFANMSSQHTFLRDNLLMNDSVLQISHEMGVEKVVSCLSTCVFPDKASLIHKEKIHTGPPHPSNFGYSHAKRLIDVQNHAYHDQFGDQFTSVIPTNVFGPGDNYNLESAHVIPGLIHKCYLAKENGTPFVVFGSGKPLRQFIYSRDLAKLFIWVLRKYSDIDPVILSVAENDEITIREVADAIVEAMGFEGSVKYDTSKADGQYRKPASNDKLTKLMVESGSAEFEFTPFKSALQESVNWFLANYDKDARI